MNFYELVTIYDKMRKNGVVIFGAGNEGKLALEVLQSEGIKVFAIADNIKKTCGDFPCISLEQLIGYEKNVVCVVSPLRFVDKEKMMLSKHFKVVVDNYLVHMIKYCAMPTSYKSCFPFNHYESPYLSLEELGRYSESSTMPEGVDLNKENQYKVMREISRRYPEFQENIRKTGKRYTTNNNYYNWEDAVVLSTFMILFNTKKIIEIGSGYSTFRMLDTSEEWCGNAVSINCIEPYPTRLLGGLHKEDRIEINKKFVQQMPLTIFEELEKNDILFIDSSHVAKSGGDIPYEYFQIFPKLKSGVIIHVHDIFYPFIYPKSWLEIGRCYNEAFILRALLTDNEKYEIMYFNNMMHGELKKTVGDEFESGSSIWLRKK